MNRNNIELMVWGDGTIRLSFWDNVNGNDIILVLNEDGTVCQSNGDDEQGQEQLALVDDLVATLREMAGKWGNKS